MASVPSSRRTADWHPDFNTGTRTIHPHRHPQWALPEHDPAGKGGGTAAAGRTSPSPGRYCHDGSATQPHGRAATTPPATSAVTGRPRLEIALRAVLDRLPTLRPAAPAEAIPFEPGDTVRGMLELPVAW